MPSDWQLINDWLPKPHIGEFRNAMRPTFALNCDLQPVSVIVSQDTPNALRIGTSILFVKPHLNEFGEIPAGAKGFVEFIDNVTGLHEILMEGAEPALLPWGNKIVLSPFESDDLASCLVVVLRQVMSITETLNEKVTRLRNI
ncbi:hypothetical protein [Bradyrhizobium sp. BR 10289]|uniref:hypothetical protein n=1 Tax=Bradyrhizobium sp. BR 10289 TaxID=2749993 RepID=UPI001C654808|nr:hypothetical protein [Bradyrhizobium sp. BR 10289]MBW7970938.1 hypothetical protein [Bradyrhizobium sp. BR 10289]